MFADQRPDHQVRMAGDARAHEFLMERLSEERPDDVVLSEEGRDDLRRLDHDRVWIVDPLDGTRDYSSPYSDEYAVHVALVEGGVGTAAAVDVPDAEMFGSTEHPELGPTTGRTETVVVTGRASARGGRIVADAIDARLIACGSAGVKAMLVVSGAADVYVHASQLYEWDVCAPGIVAEAAGLVVTNLLGEPLTYNHRYPIVEGLVISRPPLADQVNEVLARYR